MKIKKKPIIVSACLLGVSCRFDGSSKPCQKVIELFRQGGVIPLCPEQLGGLRTPRAPSEIKKFSVVTKNGKDVSKNFKKGAEEALSIARLAGVKKAILKSKSPSCGCGRIYDGSFTHTLVKGNGIFAEMCVRNGIEVLTEEDLE